MNYDNYINRSYQTSSEYKKTNKQNSPSFTSEKTYNSYSSEKYTSAEYARGRATFNLLSNASQSELSQKVNEVCKKLQLTDSREINDLQKSCSKDGKYDNKLVAIAEEFYNLAEEKPEELKYCWQYRLYDIINIIKNSNGEINEEKYDAAKELLQNKCISTRGIEDIIKGCTEYHRTQDGYLEAHFNKKAFELYRQLPEINHKSMYEKDDTFTLYIGRIFKGCSGYDFRYKENEDYLFNPVAFNLAKRLYEQGVDVINMDDCLKSFAQYKEDNNTTVGQDFIFKPTKNDHWAEKMIANLKTSIRNEDVIEACKIDGNDSLHNLLIADTLINMGDISSWQIPYMIKELPKNDNYISTTFVSNMLQAKEPKYSISDLQSCMDKNGTVNGTVWRKVQNKEISAHYIEACKINGEFNYDNIEVLEELLKKKDSEKYEDYQIKEIFTMLKNKDGIVDKTLIPLLDEFKKHTHLAPEMLKDCMTNDGKVDMTLYDLKKSILQKKIGSSSQFWSNCKNEDGTANPDGIKAVKTLIDSDITYYGYINPIIEAFKDEKGINQEELHKFTEEYKTIDKSYSSIILDKSKKGEIIDIHKFKALKEAMGQPEIKALMDNSENSLIVQAKLYPDEIDLSDKSSGYTDYHLAHMKQKDIETFEKNNYPARYYNSLGKGFINKMTTSEADVKSFETAFITTNEFDNNIKQLPIEISIEDTYQRKSFSEDLQTILNTYSEKDKSELERAFNIKFNQNSEIEGFPKYFEEGTTAPTGKEKEFNEINNTIMKFYKSEIICSSKETQDTINTLLKGFPEFKMFIGQLDEDGNKVDVTTLKNLQKLITSNEYNGLSTKDKTVAKMTILFNSLSQIDSKEKTTSQSYMSDNDGLTVDIQASWKKNAEYANTILERYNISDKDKYRITQLLNDSGWSKEYEKGELSTFDIAVNQRYEGDEKLSPLLEKIIYNSKDIDTTEINKKADEIHKNQQYLMLSDLKEFEPYIQTTIVNGKPLKYVDLSNPELKDKTIMAHFLGYDNKDHTLNLVKNKAYRSAWSTSLIRVGQKSEHFAGRDNGIVFAADNENVCQASSTNIDSGFGKQYSHIKESLSGNGYRDIKDTVKKELNLNNDEYGELMKNIIHKDTLEIEDCIINGRRISKEDIIEAHKKGVDEIAKYKGQNEVTVLNPTPIGVIGYGDSLDEVYGGLCNAVYMAQANDMVLFWGKNEA